MDAITFDKNPALNKVCHQKDSIISHNLCVRRTLFGTLLYSAFYRPHVGEVTCPALIENSPRLHCGRSWTEGVKISSRRRVVKR